MSEVSEISSIGSLTGRTVISLSSGNKIGRVTDAQIDPLNGQLLGLTLDEAKGGTMFLLPLEAIYSFGRDAVMAESDGSNPEILDCPVPSVRMNITATAADASIMRRVFDNLLMNASLHAGQNASVILQAEQSGDFVRFTVADDGPGVPVEEAERIFDPFVTLASSGTRRTHGLGLAYCRAALAAMRGSISLAPSDHGAMFVIQLPAATVLTRQALEQDQ